MKQFEIKAFKKMDGENVDAPGFKILGRDEANAREKATDYLSNLYGDDNFEIDQIGKGRMMGGDRFF
jgi:hypothetical protein